MYTIISPQQEAELKRKLGDEIEADDAPIGAALLQEN